MNNVIIVTADRQRLRRYTASIIGGNVMKRIRLSPEVRLINKNIRSFKDEEFYQESIKAYGSSMKGSIIEGGRRIVAHDESCHMAKFGPGNLILSELNKDQSIMIVTGIPQERLRLGVFYWGCIEAPVLSSSFDYGNRDYEILRDSGYVVERRINIDYRNKSIGDVFYDAYIEPYYEDYSQYKYLNVDTGVMYGEDYKITNDSMAMMLMNVLPVPVSSVPIEEVLKFREERKDEFDKFNCMVDRYQEVLNGSGSPQEEIKFISCKICEALRAIDTTMEESKIKRWFASRKLFMKEPVVRAEDLMGIGAGVAIDSVFGECGFPTLISVALATVSVFVGIKKTELAFDIEGLSCVVSGVNEKMLHKIDVVGVDGGEDIV